MKWILQTYKRIRRGYFDFGNPYNFIEINHDGGWNMDHTEKMWSTEGNWFIEVDPKPEHLRFLMKVIFENKAAIKRWK